MKYNTIKISDVYEEERVGYENFTNQKYITEWKKKSVYFEENNIYFIDNKVLSKKILTTIKQKQQDPFYESENAEIINIINRNVVLIKIGNMKKKYLYPK